MIGPEKQADIIIESIGIKSYILIVKNHVDMSGSGVVCRHENGTYEVTAKKLRQLRQKYTVEY